MENKEVQIVSQENVEVQKKEKKNFIQKEKNMDSINQWKTIIFKRKQVKKYF